MEKRSSFVSSLITEHFQDPLENSGFLDDIFVAKSDCPSSSIEHNSVETNKKLKRTCYTNESTASSTLKDKKFKRSSEETTEDFLIDFIAFKSKNQGNVKSSQNLKKRRNIKQIETNSENYSIAVENCHNFNRYSALSSSLNTATGKHLSNKNHKTSSACQQLTDKPFEKRNISEHSNRKISEQFLTFEEDFLVNFVNSSLNNNKKTLNCKHSLCRNNIKQDNIKRKTKNVLSDNCNNSILIGSSEKKGNANLDTRKIDGVQKISKYKKLTKEVDQNAYKNNCKYNKINYAVGNHLTTDSPNNISNKDLNFNIRTRNSQLNESNKKDKCLTLVAVNSSVNRPLLDSCVAIDSKNKNRLQKISACRELIERTDKNQCEHNQVKYDCTVKESTSNCSGCTKDLHNFCKHMRNIQRNSNKMKSSSSCVRNKKQNNVNRNITGTLYENDCNFSNSLPSFDCSSSYVNEMSNSFSKNENFENCNITVQAISSLCNKKNNNQSHINSESSNKSLCENDCNSSNSLTLTGCDTSQFNKLANSSPKENNFDNCNRSMTAILPSYRRDDDKQNYINNEINANVLDRDYSSNSLSLSSYNTVQQNKVYNSSSLKENDRKSCTMVMPSVFASSHLNGGDKQNNISRETTNAFLENDCNSSNSSFGCGITKLKRRSNTFSKENYFDNQRTSVLAVLPSLHRTEDDKQNDITSEAVDSFENDCNQSNSLLSCGSDITHVSGMTNSLPKESNFDQQDDIISETTGSFENNCKSSNSLHSSGSDITHINGMTNSLPKDSNFDKSLSDIEKLSSNYNDSTNMETLNFEMNKNPIENRGSSFHSVSLTPVASCISLLDSNSDYVADKFDSNRNSEEINEVFFTPDSSKHNLKDRKLNKSIKNIIKKLDTGEPHQECDASLKHQEVRLFVADSLKNFQSCSSVPKSNVLEGLHIFVDVWCDENNFSKCIAFYLKQMGCRIAHRMTRNVTHLVFKEGHHKHYIKALKYHIPIVSVLWVEMCRSFQTKIREDLFQATVSYPLSCSAGKKLKEKAVISTEIKDKIKQTELFFYDGEGRYDEQEGNKQKYIQNADSDISVQNFQDLDTRDVELHMPNVNCVENSSDAIALQCIAKDLKRQSDTPIPMNFQQELTHQTSTSDYFSDKGTFCTVNVFHERTAKCNNVPYYKHQQNEAILEQREDSCNSDSDSNADVTLVINDHDCCLPTISDNVNIQSLQEFQTRESMESDTTLICNDTGGNNNNADVMNDHVQDTDNENFVETLTSDPATEERITFSKYNRDLLTNASSSVLTHQNKNANINVTSSGDTDFLVSLLSVPSINNSHCTSKSKTFYLSSNTSKSVFSQDVQKVPIDVVTSVKKPNGV